MDAKRSRKAYWDQVSPEYNSLYSGAFSRREDARLQYWLESAIDFRKKPRILDIGCGTGLGLFLLRRISSNFSYVGIDVSEGMLSQFRSRIARSPVGIEVDLIVCDAHDIERLFEAQRFDVIIMINAVASYLGGPTRLLRRTRSVLAENGLIFASFLNRHSLRRLLRRERSVIEIYNTRGVDGGLQGIEAITIERRELEIRCMRSGFSPRFIRFQSVLGGVWEGRAATSIEAVVEQIAPSLGHTINLLAKKI